MLNCFVRRTTHPTNHLQSLRSLPNGLFSHQRPHERPHRAEGICLRFPLVLHVVYEQVHPLTSIPPPRPQPPPQFLPPPPMHPRLPPARRAQTYSHLNTSLHLQSRRTRNPDSQSSQETPLSTLHLSQFLTLTTLGLYWTKS